MKAIRAGSLVLATVMGLISAPASFAQEATTEPTTTDQTTSTESTTTEGTTTAAEPDPWAETARTRSLRNRAGRDRIIARRLSGLMQRDWPEIHRTRADFQSLLGYRLWLYRAWRLRAARARHRAHHPPHLAEWLCIHRLEGSWTDPNSPYYGGLQMDISFQRIYGPSLLRRKGTADHWAPYEQMWIAERAVEAARGFYPWPLAARRCGLL